MRDTDQYVQRLLRAGYIGIRLKFFGDMKLPASCVRFGGAFVVKRPIDLSSQGDGRRQSSDSIPPILAEASYGSGLSWIAVSV